MNINLIGVFPTVNLNAICPACDQPSDRFGHHAIACGVHGERISRHNDICNVLYRTAQKAGLGPAREFRGLIPGTAARPADISLGTNRMMPLRSVRKGIFGAPLERRKDFSNGLTNKNTCSEKRQMIHHS